MGFVFAKRLTRSRVLLQVSCSLPVEDREALLPVVLQPVLAAVGAHRRVCRVAGHGLATLWSLAQAEVGVVCAGGRGGVSHGAVVFAVTMYDVV